MSIDSQTLQPTYIILGFLLLSNLGTILTLFLNNRSKKDDKSEGAIKELSAKIDELSKRVGDTRSEVAKLEGMLEVAMPNVFAIPKMKDDINVLWQRVRGDN